MRYWYNMIIRIAAAIVSALLLWAGFPQFDQSLLVWIGLVPLLLAITDTGIISSFFLSLFTGMLFFLGIFDWILEVPGYTFFHHSLLAVYLGSFFGFFGLIYNSAVKRLSVLTALFATPFLWVSFEFLRSNLSFLALPWGLLSHSQYKNPFITQISAITGAYGVSFLIVMINAAIVVLILSVLPFQKANSYIFFQSAWRKGRITFIAAAIAMLAFALIYGSIVIKKPITGDKYKLALLQGNIKQSDKWNPKHAKQIMQIYSALSREASKQNPALVIWPESATPGAIFRNPRLYQEVINIARLTDSYLLLGSTHPQKFKRPGAKGAKYVNSAFLISPSTGKSRPQRYDKVRLFPFGEYLPYEKTIPWSALNVPKITDYVSGKNYTVFKHPAFSFGVTICWENIFPDLFRQFVKNGAQFIINITNEAWFGQTSAPYQFLSMSVLRAVENRVYVARCTNTGVSSIIDPYGRVVDRLVDEHGDDIFIRGFLIGSVIPLQSNTVYTSIGDWLAILCVFFSASFIAICFLRKPFLELRKTRRTPSKDTINYG